jgi:hypothetical protein
MKLFNLLRFLLLKRTNKLKSTLKHRRIEYRGKTMLLVDAIKTMASELPKLKDASGNMVDHYNNMRKFYYKYDLPGLNYYMRTCSKTAYIEIKKQIKLIEK